MTDATILLVDASPYIFRAHFALPDSLVDRQGRPSNAVYGFATFLLKLIADEEPTHLAVAFDRSLSTSFRNQIFPDYKKQRELPPADLEAQLEDCESLAHAIGAAAFSEERYEADDLLGTLCERTTPSTVIVVSSDKDLSQLVDSRVQWLDYGKQTLYDADGVEARFGVEPRRIPDLLGLAGDSVDNIPGVAGVGPKTALKLLAHFASVEELCDRAGEIGGLGLRGGAGVQRRIEQQREQALLSKELATVARDVPMRATLDDLRLVAPRRRELAHLFDRLGFDSLHRRILDRA